MRSPFGPGRYANVTATLALCVAVSGTAYAANTVRSADIVNGEVKSKDLGKNSVKSNKVRNRSLKAADFAAGELPEPGATAYGQIRADGGIRSASPTLISVTRGVPTPTGIYCLNFSIPLSDRQKEGTVVGLAGDVAPQQQIRNTTGQGEADCGAEPAGTRERVIVRGATTGGALKDVRFSFIVP